MVAGEEDDAATLRGRGVAQFTKQADDTETAGPFVDHVAGADEHGGPGDPVLLGVDDMSGLQDFGEPHGIAVRVADGEDFRGLVDFDNGREARPVSGKRWTAKGEEKKQGL